MGWTSSRPTNACTSRIARSCSKPFPKPDSTTSFPPTARSISMSTSAIAPWTASPSPKRCSRTSALPPRPASTSTPSVGAVTCASATPAPPRTWQKRRDGSQAGAVSRSRHEGALVPKALPAGLRACFALVGHGLPLALLTDLADLHGFPQPGFGGVLHRGFRHERCEAFHETHANATHLHALRGDGHACLSLQQSGDGACD